MFVKVLHMPLWTIYEVLPNYQRNVEQLTSKGANLYKNL